ncbi:MAG TPA: cytochrome c biogenesis protein CcdA [Bacteroidales bacterium]|nr:cytochrome c biogenesis protein CcdA [Bacteroidales bacterium]
MILRRFPLFFAMLLLFSAVQSQIIKPVKWNSRVDKVSDTEANIVLTASIDQGWHLYSQYNPEGGSLPLVFTISPSNAFALVGKVAEYPKPTEHYEEVFKITEKFWAGKAYFTQKIKVLTDKPFDFEISLSGQACQDDGYCVQIEDDLVVKVDGSQYNKENPVDTTVIAVVDTGKIKPDTSKTETATLSPDIEDAEKAGSGIWGVIIEAILWGFVALLTPCVFPMVPMTVSFFLKGSENKAKSRFNASVFGISIVALYTIPIAILIGVTYFVGGQSITTDIFNFLSTHWIPNVIFFLVFIIFAASFFGAFEIVLPSWMTSKADSKADRGGILGSFFMALTLVLVSFSCTGPIVGTIIVKSTQGEIWEPIITMLAFSAAFALPFTLLAFFPSWMKNLPKSGGWLNSVKVVLGFIEVALGFKFLSVADQVYHWGILDRETYLAIWIVTFTLLGFYLLGKLKFKHDSEVKYLSVGRLGMAIAVFAFVVYMIPGMWGAPLRVLSGYLPPQQTLDFDMPRIVREAAMLNGGGSGEPTKLCEKPKFEDILPSLPHGLEGYHDFDQALKCAKEQNKPLFVDFTGHGCVNCREMEANVWSAPEVLKRLKNDYIVVALYVDDKTELPESEWITSTYDGKVKKTIGRKFADLQVTRYEQNAQPYYCLLDTAGKDLVKPRAYDLDVDAFVQFLDNGLKEFKARQGK